MRAFPLAGTTFSSALGNRTRRAEGDGEYQKTASNSTKQSKEWTDDIDARVEVVACRVGRAASRDFG